MLVWFRYQTKVSNNRIVAWTGTSEAGDKCVFIYSTNMRRVIAQIPGTLLIGPEKDQLVCYEYKDGTVSVYYITDQWKRIPIANVEIPDCSRIVAWIDEFVYYIQDSMLMRSDETGEQATITMLKGENVYQTNPQPSYDGKWAYSYPSPDGYKIDIITTSGDIVATLDGLHHAWYDTDQLLFQPTIGAEGLDIYNCITSSIEPIYDLSLIHI